MPTFSRHLNPGVVSLFFRQLASMISAGIKAKDALDILGNENEDSAVLHMASHLKRDVDNHLFAEPGERAGGLSWLRSLMAHLAARDDSDAALPEMIYRIADDHESMEIVKRRFKAAMTYPAVTLVVAAVVLGVIVTFVVPTFEEMFQSFGTHLPGPTALIFDLSAWLSRYAMGVVLIILAFIGLVIYHKTFRDRLFSLIPGLSGLLKSLLVIRFSRYLALMMALDMPLRQALDVAVNASSNKIHAEELKDLVKDVETPGSLVEALNKSGYFSVMALRMLSEGEKRGSLPQAFQALAQYYEKSRLPAFEGKVRMFEIFAMLSIAMFIGTLVISLYLPIFSMAGAL